MFVPVYAMQCIGASFTLHYIKLSKRCTLLFGVSRSPYVSFYHTEIFAVLVNTQKMRAHKPTPLHFSLHTPPFGSWLWNRWDSSRQERKREREMKRKQCTQFDNGEKKKKIVNTTMRRNSIPKFSLQTFSVFSVFSVTSLLWCICCSDAWTEKKNMYASACVVYDLPDLTLRIDHAEYTHIFLLFCLSLLWCWWMNSI